MKYNSQQKRQAMLFLFGLVLLAVNTLLFGVLWYRYYRNQMYIYTFFAKGDIGVIGLFGLLYFVFARLYGGFDVMFHSVEELSYSHLVALALSCGMMYFVTALLIRAMPNVVPMLLMMLCAAVAAFLWALCAKKLTLKLLRPRPTVLIYDNWDAREDGEAILKSLPSSFTLLDSISAESGKHVIRARLRETKARAIMLCGVPSSIRNDLVKYCIDNGIEAYVRPNIGDFLIKGAKQLQLDNLPVLLCQRSSPAIWYLAVKRIMDIVLSLLALVVFSPFMLVTAVAIKLYDGGPILYKQVRLTKDRKEFNLYKFRSMRVDAEKDGVARLARENDDRITPVGKIIRMVRIDEIPQLFCILSGAMSIVGPRPERPEIAAQYEREMPEFALRLQAKAGLTGMAQVYGKYNTTPYNKLQMDLQYIGSMGIVTDLKIIFATVKILFQPESTEGVAQSQTTASRNEEK